jgi:drug/metabolite transporter (DMT)-like permease
MIPIALATILFNLAPFWTSFMGYFINGERIYMFQYFAMAICLVLIVCLTLTKDSPSTDAKQPENTYTDTVMGIIISIIASINGAAMNISNRRL